VIAFETLCRLSGLPEPEREYRFAPPRKFRFDFCWPSHALALECQGGLFTGGRHVRGAALLREHEKLNIAAQKGFRILYCTPRQIENGEALSIVEKALR
jgi:hypothetical protein